MQTMLSAKSLISHFEEQSDGKDRSARNASHGKEPRYPMLVLFLGADAMAGYQDIAHNLLRMWPQYHDELFFVGVREDGGSLSYVRLNDGEAQDIDEAEMGRVMDTLTLADNHFADHTRQLLYYVVDTTSFSSGEDMRAWLSRIEGIKEDLYIEEDQILEMLFILLNESRLCRKTAAMIRNVLADRCADGAEGRYRVVLLSNLLKGNLLEENWNNCYHICADLIALSNNSDDYVADIMYDRGVATVGYVRQEKPIREAGQVVVECLIDYLAPCESSSELGNVNALTRNLANRLGLMGEERQSLLSTYVDTELMPLLPSEQALDGFPRSSSADATDLAFLTARELDESTFGTWSCIVDEAMRTARERIHGDYNLRRQWERVLGERLEAELGQDELIYLAEHHDVLRDALSESRSSSPDTDPYEYARRKLLNELSSDDLLVEITAHLVDQQAQRSLERRDIWDGLHSSRLKLHGVRDENLRRFYEGKVQRFFDNDGDNFTGEFRNLASAGDIEGFLLESIDRIMGSDPVFAASFEDELQERLGQSRDSGAQEMRDYIRRGLSGDQVRVFLRSSFSQFGATLLSSALLKTDSRLKGSLTEFLNEGTYYYDTGYGNSVEVIDIIEVQSQNLRSGE